MGALRLGLPFILLLMYQLGRVDFACNRICLRFVPDTLSIVQIEGMSWSCVDNIPAYKVLLQHRE